MLVKLVCVTVEHNRLICKYNKQDATLQDHGIYLHRLRKRTNISGNLNSDQGLAKYSVRMLTVVPRRLLFVFPSIYVFSAAGPSFRN